MDKNDIIEYVMNTPHNTNKAVLSGMLNQLTEGGGSSDFSTANMTVTITQGEAYITVPAAFPGDEVEDGYATARQIMKSGVYPVILYEGRCLATTYPFIEDKMAVVAVTGNAEARSGGAFIITGDCTVTVTLEDV